ncbi:MAG TPA: hypothetical protein VFV77_01610, partial [Gammaproteobacteria bacterium]|nr:hypothetical protein [Gammaproteobacteria bacterium]
LLMAVLNLRNVPEELVRRLKTAAARKGQPFHSFCVDLLSLALLHGLDVSVVGLAADAVAIAKDPRLRSAVARSAEMDLPPGVAPKAAEVRFEPTDDGPAPPVDGVTIT